jgi:hypothetical protein
MKWWSLVRVPVLSRPRVVSLPSSRAEIAEVLREVR